jgi:hypothetical protein
MGADKIFPIIFTEQITILPLAKNRKKPDNTTILSFGRIVRYKNLLWKGVSCAVLLVRTH